jgi:Tfp pilus assembly protein PilF
MNIKGGVKMKRLFTILLIMCFCGTAWAAGETYEDLMDKGIELMMRNDPKAAAEAFEKAVQKKRDPEAYLLLGTARNALGEYREALEALKTAKRYAPDSTNLPLELGKAYLGLKEYDRAYDLFQKDIKSNEWRGESYLYAGACLYNKGEYEEAIDYLKDSMTVDIDTYSRAYYYIGLCQIKLEQYGDAERSFNNVIKFEGDSQLGRNAVQAKKSLRGAEAREKRQRPWYLNLTAGSSWDTNVLSAGDDLILPTGVSNQRDLRGDFSAAGGYRPFKNSKSEIWVDVNGSATLQEKLSSYNTQTLGATIRGVYTPTKRILAGMRVGYNYTWTDMDRYSGVFSLVPSFSYLLTDWARSTFGYFYERSRFYTQLTDNRLNRDGYTNGLSFSQALEIPGTQLYFLGFLKQSWTQARGSDYDYWSFNTGLSASHPLPLDSRISVGCAWKFNDYYKESSRSPQNVEREDNQWRLNASLSKKFTDNISAFVAFSWTDNESNESIFEYEREIYSAGITYAF